MEIQLVSTGDYLWSNSFLQWLKFWFKSGKVPTFPKLSPKSPPPPPPRKFKNSRFGQIGQSWPRPELPVETTSVPPVGYHLVCNVLRSQIEVAWGLTTGQVLFWKRGHRRKSEVNVIILTVTWFDLRPILLRTTSILLEALLRATGIKATTWAALWSSCLHFLCFSCCLRC